jgi:hypothetical protein
MSVALSYGTYPNFPVSALLAGADKDRKIDLQMMVWLLRGPGGKKHPGRHRLLSRERGERKRHSESHQSF